MAKKLFQSVTGSTDFDKKLLQSATGIAKCDNCYKVRHIWTYFTPCSNVSIVNFEKVNAGWVAYN